MNRFKTSFALLPAVILTGILPLTAQAIPIVDQFYNTIDWITGGSGSGNKYCDKYTEYQAHIQHICDRYTEDKTQKITLLPEASKLKPNTLYLVSTGKNTIVTPYNVPDGTSILPEPGVDLNLVPKGVGSDDDCGLCVLKLNENSRVAGALINIPKASWNPAPKAGKPKAVIFVKGKKAEFSASSITGSQAFDAHIYSRVDSNDDMMLSFKNLVLYTNGTQYGIKVENVSGKGVTIPNQATRNVEVLGSIVVMSDTPKDATLPQAGISLNNVLGFIGGSTVAFSPLSTSIKAPRVGVKAVDTASLWLDKNVFALTKMVSFRGEDVQVSLAGDKNDKMTLFSDGNSFSTMMQSYQNLFSDSSRLKFVGQGNYLYSDLDLILDPATIAKLTSTGGVFLSTVLKAPAICSVLKEGDFNRTDPFAPTAVLGETIPGNATVLSFEEEFSNCETEGVCSWKNFPLEVAGFAVAGVALGSLVTGTLVGIMAYKCGHKVGKGYKSITAE